VERFRERCEIEGDEEENYDKLNLDLDSRWEIRHLTDLRKKRKTKRRRNMKK